MTTTRPRLTDLDRAYLRWRSASLERWRGQLGPDAEDFLGTVYLRVQRLGTGYCHRTDPETFRWLERVAGFALMEFRRSVARELAYAVVGLESEEGEVIEPVRLTIGREEAEAILREVKIPVAQRVALMGRMFGLGDDVIAAQLGIEPESVGKYVQRAVEAAREGVRKAA